MEHCSEQDDVREREYGEDDDDEVDDEVDDDDKELELRRQQQRLAQQHHQQLKYSPSQSASQPPGHDDEEEDEDEDARTKQAKKKRPNARTHHSQSSVSSVVSDLALGVSPITPSRGQVLEVKSSPSPASLVSPPTKAKTSVSRSRPRQTSVQPTLENVLDQIEDDNQGHDGSGVHSQAGRGLRFYSQRVCDRVQAKGATTYNELVHELSGGQPGEHVEDVVGQESSGQENIRRRVYDALNVLEALGIISMDKKEIQWIGVENSRVLNETTKKSTSQSYHRRELDEESEEPEDDDMDIEQLQREVDALKLRNELERAQLQDQVSRHVQLNNLVARNKLREAKEQERHERRKQRKFKREEGRARGNADGDDSGNPDMEPTEEKKKKSERRRHRSPRHRPEERGHGDEDEEEGGEDPHAHEGETKEERRARKEARRERRERKEKRAQRRQERESAMLEEGEKIQMPFVVIRIPRYAGQSSDSEASISVVRRVREARPKKSSKAKRQEETTMVEIQIPHQEELCIISDTEILGDLGLGTVSMNDLKTMLPKDLLGNARYVTNPGNVTVHGGFERQVVCSH
ncbi:Transcription factor Dp-2 [Podila clonocystis]|nr:Transcription factor Dp-2 [Podila clonocystis]